jgi:hypothetical protein
MTIDPILSQLSDLIHSQEIITKLTPILDGIQARLLANREWPQAWESLPLDLFGSGIPDGIKSCWFFVLRGDAIFGAERHPNSHQRSFALEGAAFFEMFADGVWSPYPVNSLDRTLEEQAISIPVNTWHRIKIGPTNFVSLSFHTTQAQELIEETPIGDDLSITQQRLYHA